MLSVNKIWKNSSGKCSVKVPCLIENLHTRESRPKVVLMKHFERLTMKGNLTFFTKVFYRFVVATTSLLIILTNQVTIVIISCARAFFKWLSRNWELQADWELLNFVDLT